MTANKPLDDAIFIGIDFGTTWTLGADLVKRTKLKVIITLPAIWPPYAQQRMNQAARKSGIHNARPAGLTGLRFISEPEAAALATIKDLAKRSTIKLRRQMFSDLCGGVFLDEAFMKLIRKKCPQASWGSVTKSDERKFLNDQGEHGIKPQFENQQRTWPVDLPDSCSAGPSRGLRRRVTLELTSTELLSVFEPITSKIETLVSLQVDEILAKHHEAPKCIILVGGFGRSRYLFNHLQAQFTSTILQSRGNKQWTSICWGAVVQGLPQYNPSACFGVNVEARVARMSQGVCFRTKFIDGVHDIRDKEWNEKEQVYKANNQMQWFLKQGDDISEKRSVIMPIIVCFRALR
ncbi:chaperone protein [Fusarium beomiforme]|uniref:Chaperone protein n=1 Tax=Fusarium beomiforme TaxID=44412 RepID=A0A9P5ATE7_9HYPO|nr:chaperone protein [Fusarium beomiforme]